ncbi:hypothetical protein LTR84_009324 [Exophiala bonariae]|uniref:DUF7730 domain-containing protein n=1 Tax=Exophiala bonariae TaxID=1690606 RepID=A0AAV9MX49_9EURO|nr:hypothetical protein LTR84_009324 [Exophiala bonariae]
MVNMSPTPTKMPFKPFPFFDLPGEIRNKIYDLVIQESRGIITGSHPNKEWARLQKSNPNQKHVRPRFRLYGHFSQHGAGAPLLLVCRQMNEEAVQHVYARTTFHFENMNTIHKFLDIVPAAGAQSIETLEIRQIGYGEPQWTDDREWKLRHDDKWKKTLGRVRERVLALQTLTLNITVFDWPCRLEMDAPWARNLLKFAGDGLDRVNVSFEHDRFSLLKICETAQLLEKKMMTSEGAKKKIQEVKLEKQRQALAQRKTRVLTILLPSTQHLNVGPAKKVVKSKGLEQYSMGQLPVAVCP